MVLKNIRKTYPTINKILDYNSAFESEKAPCRIHGKKNCQICEKRGSALVTDESSIIRTKTRVTDYVLCNEFDLFLTFTFNPNRIDSFNVQLCKKKMSNWLSIQKRHSINFKYLIVPERHKSGRLHFHALVKGFEGALIPTGRIKNTRPIYNIENWNWGFSTAVKIAQNDIEKVGYYLQKYITKDMVKIADKKRYWASRNLVRPLKEYNVDLVEAIEKKPLFLIDTYENEHYTIYKLLNSDRSCA